MPFAFLLPIFSMLPPVTTTKPGDKYRSLQNVRAYRALRRRGYTKQEAARISNAQAPGHTVKAPNYSARAGQTISGSLGRATDGKFTNSGGGSSAAPAKGAAKPKKGKQPKKPKQTPEERQAARTQEQAARRDKVYSELGLMEDAADSLTRLGAGEIVDDDGGLVKMGLAEMDSSGQLRLTANGRTALNASERGDVGAARDALSRGRDRVVQQGEQATARQGRETARQQRLQERQARAQERDKKRQEREAARLAKQQEPKKGGGGGGGGGGGDKKPEKPTRSLADSLALMRQNAELLTRRGKSFTVFKDASGRYRWLLVSSNAYEDRDREIVSTQALKDAVALADRTKERGPLRWWHVPGVELGDCDWQAVAGRHLLESGTFRSEAIGAAVARKAQNLRASIGFHHPANEPDTAGVFHHIAIFERSLVPAGRAANPWTRLVVTKEKTMLTDDKKAQLKELLGDEALLASVLDNLNQTDKTATVQGTRFKADDEAVRTIIRDEIAAALKAFPPPKKATDEEAETEAVAAVEAMPADTAEVEDKAEALPVEAEGEMDYGPSFTPEEMTEIAQAIAPVVAQAVLAELAPVLDLETKMRGYADEVKGLFTSQQRAKDDTDAQRQQQLTALQQQIAQQQTTLKDTQSKLAELMGEQPRAAGYRASSDPLTVIPEGDARLKELTPQQGPFADIYNNLFGQATPAP